MKKMNEKGMSLIEVIVCLSIMSIILTMVFRFVVIGMNTSTNATKDANVQKEAQTTVNQLKDWIMETNQGILTYKGSTGYDSVTAIYQQEKKETGKQNFVQLLYYNQEECTLYYSKKEINAEFDGSESSIAEEGRTILSEKEKKNHIFAQYVTEFEIDDSKQSEQKITIKIRYEDRGKTYKVDNVVKMRNVPKENPLEFSK